KVYFGSAYLAKAKEGGGVHQAGGPFPNELGTRELPALKNGQWRRVKIQVVDHKIRIYVDDVKYFDTETAALKRFFQEWMGEPDPRGAVGVWAEGGLGTLGKGFITPLPSEAIEK